ncbi:MAG TPA: hypothetical protein VFN10_08485 [Thermoanaerobaculia bacterium]|nr:hypothetical protein [Thermoanaerobaculia bacterium]
MNEFAFEAEVTREEGRVAEVVRERVYGAVRVVAEWPRDLSAAEPRFAVTVSGEVDRKDAPAYVELFFHDVYLLMNLASPGSFDGTVSISGGELRVRELTFSARLFSNAERRLPLERVVAWYESLGIGARQVATAGAAVAVFEVLHLARREEDDEESIIRLARAVEAVVGRPESLQRLFTLRDEIVQGHAPAYHPMHDDALDPLVLDATEEWIETADAAAGALIAALQAQVTTAG